MILQQPELKFVNQFNYFDEYSPCHLYFICRRPRLSIDPEKFEVTNEYISLTFKIQKQDTFEEKKYKFDNTFKRDDILLETKYPYNTFKLTAARNMLTIKIVFFIIHSGL